MYALQKVQIRNTIPLEEAKQHYKAITKKKPRKIRETENFYQFRYLPPTKFEKRTFRTKVVNDDIHLIFGKLKDEHQKLEGRGLFDYFTKGYDYIKNTSFVQSIKNAMSINDFSTKTKANLDKFGDYLINYIQIRRVPISTTLDLALQGVSAGEWERLKKKYGFDHFFHLSMVVNLRGAKDIVLNTGRKMTVGKQLAIEKLEVVSVNENIMVGEGMETLDVPLAGKTFSINDMFRKARDRVGDGTFFAYSAMQKNNCQDFIALLLDVEGLYRAEEKAFVYQNISELVAELPAFTKGFAQTVTDLGALVNKATGIGGSGRITLDSLHGGSIDKDEELYIALNHLSDLTGEAYKHKIVDNDYVDFVIDMIENGYPTLAEINTHIHLLQQGLEEVDPSPPSLSIFGQGNPIIIPRKKFIKEHKHLIGMMNEMCKEGKDQAKELKEVDIVKQ